MTELSDNLRHYIKVNSLTQREVAEKINTASAIVNQWVLGNHEPNAHFIPPLAEALSISPLQLLTNDSARFLNDDYQLTPEDVKTCRLMLGMNQLEFAKLFNVSKPMVGFWEKNRCKINQSSADKILNLLRKEAKQTKHVDNYDTITPWQITKIRTQLHLTQAELGNKLGVSRGAVNNWEAGNYLPSAKNIRALHALASLNKPVKAYKIKYGFIPKIRAIDDRKLDEYIDSLSIENLRLIVKTLIRK